VFEDLFYKKIPGYPECADASAERVLEGRVEAEDITILDYHVFLGVLLQPFRFVSGVKIEFSG